MSKVKMIVVLNILLIISSLFFINYLGRNINDKFLEYAEIEATKIAKYIVNYAATKKMLADIELNNLFETTKNQDDEIKSIEFNTVVVNELLNEVTNSILKMFKDFENGNSDIMDLSWSFLNNTKIYGYKNGIIFDIPIGMATDNFVLSNIGPRIPVRISLTGEIESNISTSIVEYGINNALVTVFINIEVSEQVLMPFKSDRITIKNKIPIAMSIINGKIPNYYANGIVSNSPLFNLPTE